MIGEKGDRIVHAIELRVAARVSVVVNGGVLGCLLLLTSPRMRLMTGKNGDRGLACALGVGLHHLYQVSGQPLYFQGWLSMDKCMWRSNNEALPIHCQVALGFLVFLHRNHHQGPHEEMSRIKEDGL